MNGKIIIHATEVDDGMELGLEVDVKNVDLTDIIVICTGLCNALGVPDHLKTAVAMGMVRGVGSIEDEQYIQDEAQIEQTKTEKGWVQ